MGKGERCEWARSEAEAAYHDAEWGVPSRDPVHLFEMITLEGAQAGLVDDPEQAGRVPARVQEL